MQTLDIEYMELAPDRVVMTMPVGPKTHQPAGILHGGASVLLAETVASIASFININSKKYAAVGLEINANHIKSKSGGIVTAVATPLHKGRKTMVWDVKITDELNKLICGSRCTVANIDNPDAMINRNRVPIVVSARFVLTGHDSFITRSSRLSVINSVAYSATMKIKIWQSKKKNSIKEEMRKARCAGFKQRRRSKLQKRPFCFE